MGKPTGFLDYERETAKVLPPKERIQNFNEFRIPLNKEKQKLQGARCMACGGPVLPVRYDDHGNDKWMSTAQSGTGVE